MGLENREIRRRFAAPPALVAEKLGSHFVQSGEVILFSTHVLLSAETRVTNVIACVHTHDMLSASQDRTPKKGRLDSRLCACLSRQLLGTLRSAGG